ncbi:MAG: DUF721 domain-containing protein [Bacteroidales bacterium]|jgi:hypothetical protein|nr:DUF721 domain-containing protein [Bacteroidales bacterium]
MSYTSHQTIGTALDAFFKKSGYYSHIKEAEIREQWSSIVGTMFAKATTNIAFKNKTMFVSVNSAAIKQELFLNRTTIVYRINEKIKEPYIKEIIFR